MKITWNLFKFVLLAFLIACAPKAAQLKAPPKDQMSATIPDAKVRKIKTSDVLAPTVQKIETIPIEEQAEVLPSLKNIEVNDLESTTEVILDAEAPIIYTTFRLTDPPRFVVDLSGIGVGNYRDKLLVNRGAIVEITPIEMDKPSHGTRLEILLSQPIAGNIKKVGDRLVISFERPKEIVVQPIQVPEKPVEEKVPAMTAQKESETTITGVSIQKNGNGSKVVILGDGEFQYKAFVVKGNRLVLDIPQTINKVTPAIISGDDKLLKRIRIGQHLEPIKRVRIVFDVNKEFSYTVSKEDTNLIVSIMEKVMPVAEVPKTAPVESEVTTPSAPEVEVPEVPEIKAPEVKVLKAPPKKVEKEVPTAKYTGRRISLDFQDADIRNILRLLADVSGLNIVISDDVKGKITIKLLNVPWDQALELILKTNGLGQIKEGNIIRIATLSNITKQQDEEAKAKDSSIKAEDLVTKIIYINYAKAKDLVEPIKKALSVRGEITIDDRTNTLIVKDIQQKTEEVSNLIKTLDTPTPQVLIEARIVQATTDFAKNLGIQWGGMYGTTGTDAFLTGYGSTGTVAPLIFTPSGFIGSTGVISEQPEFAVNLPAATPLGAIGFTFGKLTGDALQLDLRLSAGESKGLTKIISTPKIAVLNNQEAKIEQGESIPYATTSLQGTQTTFVEANLGLNVTPQVTPDGSVLLKIKTFKNSPGSTRSGAAGPSILKKEAQTQVLLKDGETTVIGGIYESANTDTTEGIPWLSKIPILGWLFKHKRTDETKTELLVFLTPRIIK